ncbi:MAG TPA: CDP-alcohol phosphatidyltransferase family protein [Methanocella sp.]|jgi:phosphatidylglycerophosphate synthase
MDSYRSVLVEATEPLLVLFRTYRISPNTISVVALGFAVLAGIAYYFSSGNSFILALAVLSLLLNGLLDSLDGALARQTGTSSKYGDFLDHVIDRYADVIVIFGIFLGGYLPADLGALALAGVMLASYLGTQAQAVGVGRIYGGIMGRADRMIVFILATCLTIVYPASIGIQGFEFTLLGWSLLIVGALSHVTALQRIWYTRKILIGEKKN